MSLRDLGARWAGAGQRTRILLVSAAGLLLLAPGIAGAGGATGGNGGDDSRMLADATRIEHAIAVAYNDKKWAELRTMYADDALGLAPNHDPVHGRAGVGGDEARRG